MNTAQFVMSVILAVCCVVVIAVVLMQQGSQQGLGAISGSSETFFGKGKARGMQAMLGRVTVVFGIIFAICILAINAL